MQFFMQCLCNLLYSFYTMQLLYNRPAAVYKQSLTGSVAEASEAKYRAPPRSAPPDCRAGPSDRPRVHPQRLLGEQRVLSHFAMEQAGADRIHGNAVFGIRSRNALGKVNDSALGRIVGMGRN